MHMGQRLCYSTDGWLAALMRVSSAEDETGETFGHAARKTDSVGLC